MTVDIFNKEFDTVRLKKTIICVIMLFSRFIPKYKVYKYIDIKSLGNDYRMAVIYMKYKIAICDDEQKQIEYLSGVVSAWASKNRHVVEIKTYSSAKSFLFDYSEEKDFDILLLDIEMPGMNGMELAKTIRRENGIVQIVFITGYPEFMSEGYDVSALNYLMKPVNKEKLFSILDKASERIEQKEGSLVLETENGIIRINFSQIMSAEAIGHTTLLTLTDRKETAKIGINDFEKQLNDSFVRCHRSYLVGIRHISKITKTDVILDSGEMLPLSRRLYGEVNQKFIGYYKGES